MYQRELQILWWVSAFTAQLGLLGCGYTLNHRLKDSFSDRRGIFVPTFSNHTDESGAERIFTNVLIRELMSHREILLSSRQRNGLELVGEIQKIEYSPTAATAPGFQGLRDFKRIPSEYGVRVEIGLRLIDSSSKSILWANSFSGFRRVDVLNMGKVNLSRAYDYQAPSSIGVITQSILSSLYGDIATDIMRNVYDSLVEQF